MPYSHPIAPHAPPIAPPPVNIVNSPPEPDTPPISLPDSPVKGTTHEPMRFATSVVRQTPPPVTRRTSSRETRPPMWTKDYVTPTINKDDQTFITTDLSMDELEFALMAESVFFSDLQDSLGTPQSFAEASAKPQWVKSMQEEFDSLITNDTWTLMELPPGRKSIGCKWTYRTKQNSKSEVARLKSQLVAQGFTQQFGVDYQETYAPVVKHTTV
jgi:hypothetical protein